MSKATEESLLNAIIKDDIKGFNSLMEKAQCGAYRLGRFPVLSLAYLYNSRKIISAYEERFLKITAWEEKRELSCISKKFSDKADKCLRLYLNEVVSPLEMLLILNKIRRLKRVYPLTKSSAAVKARLQSIYSIRYSLNIKFEGKDIIIDRRPLSYGEKKKIATICLCSVLAVTVTVGAPLTTVALIPKRADGEVTKLSHIDFSSKKEYTLIKDITVPEDFSVEKVNCKINGNGRKITFGRNASLGELNGKITDTVIYSCGSPLFTSVTAGAALENLTVTVDADISTDANAAFVAGVNYGTVDGVTVNVSGRLNALSGSSSLTFGGIVLKNAYRSNTSYGVVKNCTVNYSGFSLVGEASANAAFGGVAGVNGGELSGCTVTGEITADTCDISGICTLNNGLLSGNLNEASLSQVSADTGWSPISSGIVMENANVVEYCENEGSISAISTCGPIENTPTVSAAGIAYLNSGNIAGCKNGGSVTAEGSGTAFVGGIAARSYASVSYCLSDGDIGGAAQSALAGGIVGVSEIATSIFNTPVYDFVRNCISESNINITVGDGESCVGGIVGFLTEGYYKGTEIYFGGGVTDCYFTGELSSDGYSGSIVGVCGTNIYESNSYTSGDTEYHYFEGNFYIDSSLTAFGAAVSVDGEFVSVEDKGATAGGAEEIKNSEEYKNILNALLKL